MNVPNLILFAAALLVALPATAADLGYRLSTVMKVGAQSTAYLAKTSDNKLVRVREGDVVQGWRIMEILDDMVIAAQGAQRAEIHFGSAPIVRTPPPPEPKSRIEETREERTARIVEHREAVLAAARDQTERRRELLELDPRAMDHLRAQGWEPPPGYPVHPEDVDEPEPDSQ